MESKSSPNRLVVVGNSLLEIEKLSRTVTRPTSGNVNHLAKGLFGLFLLYLISPALRMDFRALMTLSEITLEGEFDKTGKRLYDPDRSKRKTLRGVITHLNALQMLKTNEVGYSDIRLAQRPVLDHIPHEGIICWAGAELYVKDKPSGPKPDVFAFKLPETKIVNWQEVRQVLSCQVHPSRIEVCTRQLNSSLSLIEDLLRKNKIEDVVVTSKIGEVKNQPESFRLTYLLAATEKMRGIGKALYILPALLDERSGD